MQTINLSRRHTSRAVWETMLEDACAFESQDRGRLFFEGGALDSLRAQAQYNTGSITMATCWVIYALTRYFRPRVVAEVGTFIGRSTLSFIRGMERAGVADGRVLTCDFSNDIELPIVSNVRLTQFRKKSSTDMFQSMVAEGVKCDLLALDGRLQPQDFQLLGAILHSDSVMVLDDFEGVEKGVVNASSLMGSLQPTHNLIYPPSLDILQSFGLRDSCTTAMVVPRTLFNFSNQ